MNYLQIWLGITSKVPSQIMLGYMNSIINRLGTNDTYTLISPRNFFRNNSKVNWIDSTKYISRILIDKKLQEVWNYILTIDSTYCYQSDIIRLYYLSKNINVFYVDCDIDLKEIPIFEDKVYLAQRGSQTDHCLFYNGSNLTISMEILNYSIQSSFNIMEKDYSGINICWIINKLYKYRDRTSIIEQKYFEHHREL